MKGIKLGRALAAGVATVAILNALSALSMPVRERQAPVFLVVAWLGLLLMHAAAYHFGDRVRSRLDLGAYAGAQAAILFAIALSRPPAPLTIVEERTVGPSLGKDSIDRGKRASILGCLLIVVMVVTYYRFAGLLAVGALALYALFTLGGLALLDATLTLPGLAGFLLSVGMAVDANVLVFERIREELAQNKTVPAAVDAGFQHAMPAIVDSNLTTVLTALFLFQFGTGPVQGFAITLIIGILASFLSAVYVTRTFFLIWIQRRPAAAALPI